MMVLPDSACSAPVRSAPAGAFPRGHPTRRIPDPSCCSPRLGRHLGARTRRCAPMPVAPLSAAQLDELVAPVALYPDIVLDSLLPATTAPQDVAAAAQYGRGQTAPTEGAPLAAPEGVDWEPSVTALLQFPKSSSG